MLLSERGKRRLRHWPEGQPRQRVLLVTGAYLLYLSTCIVNLALSWSYCIGSAMLTQHLQVRHRLKIQL